MAKQRQVRMEQSLSPALMEDMQDRSDEQLESESKHRSIALAILGARAAERYDAAAARTYFQRAIAAARPQERMQIRRMADASLALAERRPDDLKHAVEKLGQAPPSGRALMGLRLMGLIVPPPGAGPLLKARGFAIVALIVIVVLGLGLGVVELVAQIFGGIGFAPALLLGLIVVGAALAVLTYFGRRRQKAARAGARPTAAVGKGSSTTKGAAAAKGSTPARGPAARGSGAARAAGAARGAGATRGGGGAGDAATPKGSAPAKGSAAARGRAPAAAKAGASAGGLKDGAPSGGAGRRGGSPRAGGSGKGAPAAKPATGGTPAKGGTPAEGGEPLKGRTPAKGAKGGSRPKRPSR